MEHTTDNLQKYDNYKEQFKRLEKALHYEFYLEALFVEYAIIEDRTESILKHADKWNAYLKKRGRYQVSLDSKVKYIQNLSREKGGILNKYFADSLLADILVWKDERNTLIHVLMKQKLTAEDLKTIADTGYEYAKDLRNRATNYRRAVERRK